ncbi:MAG TPA: ABC transporter ATP-binding protein [Ktedonobacteraceae bacterium]|nr:ABC transporter ATP-binding protein [Ktedonobacteraceae bacterium]
MVDEGSNVPEVLLDVDGVTFGYERQPLLYDVYVQVRKGEMVGLLGPNGSGKTTLLRLVSGVLQPQQGRILLDGRELQDWGRRGVAQRIAVVPQELHVPFAYTVEQLVNLGRTPFVNLLGSNSRQEAIVVQDAMQAAGVTPLANRIFNELSGGERQRVIVAMALAQQPELLLLDEPTSHLDIKYQIDILELVQRLNRERGVTVIAAMHDLNLAARYFPRLLLFQRGVVADAGPAEVLEPHLLKRVYGIDVQVGILRGAQHLSVLPPDSASIDDEREREGQPQVLVMAGGGSGELLMRALADVNIPFIAGALNIGDSDHTLALRLASAVITEQPYAPISPATLEQVRTSLLRMKLLLFCPMPIGPGNLSLLQEALMAAHRGIKVLILAPTVLDSKPETQVITVDEALQQTGIAKRDYTNGEGVRLVREMLQAGATVVESVAEAVEAILLLASSNS